MTILSKNGASVTFILFLLLSNAQIANASCELAAQCDWCSTNTHFRDVALSLVPSPTGNGETNHCDVYISKLTVDKNTEEIRLYYAEKTKENNTEFPLAFEMTPDPNVVSAFQDLADGIRDFNSLPQSIMIDPSDGINIDSAYRLVGSGGVNSSQVTLVNDYISQNHPIVSGLWSTLSTLYSSADHFFGTNFGTFLTMEVIFEDGSYGMFRVRNLGNGYIRFEPLESTFYNSEGETIPLSAQSYANSGGMVHRASVDPIAGVFSIISSQVIIIDGNKLTCTWSCESNDQCTLDCS